MKQLQALSAQWEIKEQNQNKRKFFITIPKIRKNSKLPITLKKDALFFNKDKAFLKATKIFNHTVHFNLDYHKQSTSFDVIIYDHCTFQTLKNSNDNFTVAINIQDCSGVGFIKYGGETYQYDISKRFSVSLLDISEPIFYGITAMFIGFQLFKHSVYRHQDTDDSAVDGKLSRRE